MRYPQYLALSALLLCPALAAQVPAGENPIAEKTISLEFRGGKLSELISAIRKTAGANIVASALADEVELPAISLREATVSAALMSVRAIVPEPYRVAVDTTRDSGRPVHSVTVMRIQNVSQTGVGPGEQRGVRVFSIRSLIEALPSDPPGFADKLLSANTVLSAIENGLEVSKGVSQGKTMTGGAVPWDMRFHEDSGLLFVSGSYDQLSLVQNVLQALNQDLLTARQAAIQAGWRKSEEGPKESGRDR